VRVLVRVLDTIIILLTLGIALMTFAEVRPVWGQPLRLGRRCRCAFSSRSITGRAAPRPNIGLDYTAPIERIRNKAIELVGQSTQPAAGSSSIELRILLTGANTAVTSDLCAEIREKLIGFLQRECPQALPRQRQEMTDSSMTESSASKDLKRFDDPHRA